MTTPPGEVLTAITVIFHKPVEDWTRDDRAEIIRRLRQFMRDPAAFRRSDARKRRKAKAKDDRS